MVLYQLTFPPYNFCLGFLLYVEVTFNRALTESQISKMIFRFSDMKSTLKEIFGLKKPQIHNDDFL